MSLWQKNSRALGRSETASVLSQLRTYVSDQGIKAQQPFVPLISTMHGQPLKPFLVPFTKCNTKLLRRLDTIRPESKRIVHA